MTNENSQLMRLQRLLGEKRWAALATVDNDGAPMASMVGYVTGETRATVYLHLSRLAAHTANLLATARAALVISEDDDGKHDPQECARVTLSGQTQVVERDSDEYTRTRTRYLARLPASERLFDFPDFILFRLDTSEARFVGGFGQARTFNASELNHTKKH